MPDFGSFRGFGEKLAQGQTPTQLGAIGTFGVYDADAQEFFIRVNNAGGSLNSLELGATNQLVLDLKSNGVWNLIKAIYPMVGASSAACAQNLKSSSFTGAFNGGWTFSSTGVLSNGTTGFFNSNLIPNDSLIVSNLHVSAYCRNLLYPNNVDTAIFGAVSGSTYIFGDFYNTVPNFFTTLGGQAFITAAFDNTQGLITTSIINNGTNGQKTFRNSIQKGQNTNTSTSLPTAKIYFNALNNGGTGQLNYGAYELALATIGDGLTNANVSDLYTAVQAFQTTLGRQV
jgi:hypothetical protein